MYGMLLGAVLVTVAGSVTATAHSDANVFVDCSAVQEGTGTEASPFSKLTDVSAREFLPGTTISFKRGTSCQGTLSILSSGTSAKPITVSAYGPGDARPVIDAAGGDEAIRLAGTSYLHISGLELTAPGDGTHARRGVYLGGEDTGPVDGLTLSDLDIHDITAPPSGASGGIVLATTGQSAFTDLTIEGNRIHSVDGDGIAMSVLSRKTAIRRNLLWNLGGSGISVSAAEAPAIESDIVQGFGAHSPGNGIGVAASSHATISGCEVSGGQRISGQQAGGTAYEIGKATDHADVEGDLSHDNAGGFLLLATTKDGPISDFTVRGDISVHDQTAGFTVGDGPLSQGHILGNTLYLGRSDTLKVVDAPWPAPLAVGFRDNLVAREEGGSGSVDWNLGGPGWAIDHNLFHGVPLPNNADDTVPSDPRFAVPGGNDPFGYRLLVGSPALGVGQEISELRGFPVSGGAMPAGTPNLGAVQAPATFAPVLAETFDDETAGAPPDGWTVSAIPGRRPNAAMVTADSAGSGHVLAITPVTAMVRDFPVSGGEVRADARLWTPGPGHPLRFQLLDNAANPVADVGFDASGPFSYTDGKDLRTSAFAAPPSAWTRVSLLLHPAKGTYDISVDGSVLASGRLAPGSGLPSAVEITAPGPDKGSTVAVDDVMIMPEPASTAARRAFA